MGFEGPTQPKLFCDFYTSSAPFRVKPVFLRAAVHIFRRGVFVGAQTASASRKTVCQEPGFGGFPPFSTDRGEQETQGTPTRPLGTPLN